MLETELCFHVFLSLKLNPSHFWQIVKTLESFLMWRLCFKTLTHNLWLSENKRWLLNFFKKSQFIQNHDLTFKIKLKSHYDLPQFVSVWSCSQSQHSTLVVSHQRGQSESVVMETPTQPHKMQRKTRWHNKWKAEMLNVWISELTCVTSSRDGPRDSKKTNQ